MAALDAGTDLSFSYWPYVANVLDDGRFELSNNLSKRVVKLS